MRVTTQQPPLPWKTLANICFGLAFCLSCGFLIALVNQSHIPQQIDLTCEFLLLPFWLSMTFALSVTTAKGGFDWLAKSRILQYVLVLSACFALVVVSWFSYYGWDDSHSAIVWGLRPLKAVIVTLPMTSVIGGVLALNPTLSARLPAWL